MLERFSRSAASTPSIPEKRGGPSRPHQSKPSSARCELKYCLCTRKIRTIKHGALVADRTDARICGEQIDDLLRRRQLVGAWREGLVDYIDLRRMYRQHAAVSVTPHFFRPLAKARFVAEICLNRLDRGHTGGRSAEEAKAAG
jgi:hypothetical protein